VSTEPPTTASALAPLAGACLLGTRAYLGIQDARLHPGHPMVLPEQLDLADLAELRQHCGEVGLQVDDVADAMPGSHQKRGGWLLLVLVARAQGERQTDGQGSIKAPWSCTGCAWLSPWNQASISAAQPGPRWLLQSSR